LACFALLPLLPLEGGHALPDVLLGCAADSMVALSFALPLAVRARVLPGGVAGRGYAAAACALLPLALWRAAGGRGDVPASPTPAILVPDTFVPPGGARGLLSARRPLAAARGAGPDCYADGSGCPLTPMLVPCCVCWPTVKSAVA